MTESPALEGIRVLDFSEGIAGPAATMLLGDFGADVVKAEEPGGERGQDDPGYVCWNRNKTITTIDPASAVGLAHLRRLVTRADVIVVDRPRAELERLRLDATSILETNPLAVHLWVPGYGRVGRWSHLQPDPMILAAVSGLSDHHSATEDRPVVPVVPLIAYEQAAMGATLALAGLFRRARDGRGQAVSVSGLDAVSAMLTASMVHTPGLVRRGKSVKAGIPHFRHYQCRDGRWLYLAALSQHFFLRALDVLDLMDVMVMPGIDGEWLNLQRSDVNGPVMDRLEARFAERTCDEWLDLLWAADIPCAPVGEREEWFHGETVAANGLHLVREHRELGAVELPGVPLRLSASPVDVRHLPDSDHRFAPDEIWVGIEPPGGSEAPAVAGLLPLDGIRIVDLSTFVAGTFGPTILAQLGADVIKVETADGDPYRDFSVAFAAFNQTKRGLGLDVKHPDGWQALMELVRDADVVADGVRPSVRARLRTDFASLKEVNPRVIRCSVTGWGEYGELSETPAFDPLLQARSGLMSAQGGDSEPVYVSMLVHDVGTGTLAAFGILAALLQRDRTGRGQEVSLSLASTSVFFQSGELTTFEGRRPADRGGLDWPGPSPFRRLYECCDGWIVVSACDDEEARRVLRAMESDPASLAPRIRGLAALDALDRLTAAGIDAATVLDREAAFTDPWLTENRVFHVVDQPGIGPCHITAGYGEWRHEHIGHSLPAPRNGEHTREILRQAGFDDVHIDKLVASGAAHELAD
jgi:crotonobetainyl-CoA:carnitine CoA-transferase CaiB-like acyl-CoA transferase